MPGVKRSDRADREERWGKQAGEIAAIRADSAAREATESSVKKMALVIV